MAKVAIITRTINKRTALLKRTIESVLNQRFQDWQMVIVNDGGEKSSLNKLVKKYKKRFKNRIKLIHMKSSNGKMEKVSNVGIKATKSDYVVIHDDDDSWDPLFLQKTVSFLENTNFLNVKGVVTLSTNIYERVEEDKVIVERKEPHNPDLQTIDISKSWGTFFPPISFLYKREVYKEIGYYDEDLPVLGDWDFNVRFLRKYDIFVLREYLANYHYRTSSTGDETENSLFTTASEHSKIDRAKYYESHIRNRYLRNDIENNRFGIGHIISMSEVVNMREEVRTLYNFYDRIRRNRILRFLYSLIPKRKGN